MSKKLLLICFSALFLLSIAMHFNVFKTDLIGKHLWRQSQTQLNIQQFTRYDYNILNPRHNCFNNKGSNILRMEFPIMQWLIASVNKIFGESILNTRICMFLFGFLGVIGMYLLILELFFNKVVALITAVAFNFSPVFYYYTMNPLPDVFALSMGIFALAYFIKYKNSLEGKYMVISAIFMSVSILAKLPYILFGALPATYFIQTLIKRKEGYQRKTKQIFISYSLALLGPILWYGWVMGEWGTTTIVGGIIKTPLPAERYWYILKHHLEVMWPRLLMGYPSLIIFFVGIFYILKNKKYLTSNFWLFGVMGLGLLGYFFFEISMIDIVHDYYMMPFFLIFFVIIAYGITQILDKNILYQSFLSFAIIAMPIHAYFTSTKLWSVQQSFYDPTLLNDREALRNIVPNDAKCIMINDYSGYIFPYLIDKLGYVFDHDHLPKEWVDDMIRNYDVKYMYSTTRVVDSQEDFQIFYDSLIYEKGAVKVFKLKVNQ